MSIKAAKQTTIQLLKYGVIGISNTLITLAVFYIVNTLCGLPYSVANVAGYVLGLINSFIWNRNWVFKTKRNLLREAALFAVGFFICFGLQFATSLYLLNFTVFAQEIRVEWLPPMKNLSNNIVMCLSMVVYTLSNYCYNRFVTFRQKHPNDK